MMTEEITLAKLADEIAQLRQQVEAANRRLDMIYGAVTSRNPVSIETGFLESQLAPANTTSTPPATGAQAKPLSSAPGMMNPGGEPLRSIVDALHQHAVASGLDVSKETLARLKHESPGESAADE